MKKREIITEAKRKALLVEREKAIIESFTKNFNKIKRIDESYFTSFEEAKAEADKISSEEGGVAQHVNQVGENKYMISDFYDSDSTVYSVGLGIDESEYNDGEDYERMDREVQYGIDPYSDRPELIMPREGDFIENVDIQLQDGSTVKRDVKVISIYPETEEALVRTNYGGEAIVNLYDLVK
jgi:hypothetical protein